MESQNTDASSRNAPLGEPLEEAGYRRLTTTDVWINQQAKRAISSETVERHRREWLMRWLNGEITRDFMIFVVHRQGTRIAGAA